MFNTESSLAQIRMGSKTRGVRSCSKMKEVCADYTRKADCLAHCEQGLIPHDKCPVFGNKLIHAGGFTVCINWKSGQVCLTGDKI